jgi:hypothetical protein
VLINPSFETSGAWRVSGRAYIDGRRAFDGGWAAFFGGYDRANDFMAQTVTVPSWAETGALYFATNMGSLDSMSLGFDRLRISVFDQGTNFLADGSIWNNSSRDVWRTWRMPVDNVIRYRGQTMTVAMLGTTDSSLFTSWWVDRVWLVFGCGDTPAMAAAEANAVLDASASPPAVGTIHDHPSQLSAATVEDVASRWRSAGSDGQPILASGDASAVRAVMSR